MSVEVHRYAAFTDDGAGGNPAGVVLDAESLTEAQMLSIASDLGYSETAFLLGGDTPRSFSIRYFSPVAEVAFCGHATVATAVAMAERLGPGTITLATLAGPITVQTALTDAGLSATLTAPPARSQPARAEDLDEALAAIRWAHEDLDHTYPVHVAHAGNDHLVIAAASLDRLGALDYDYDRLADLMGRRGWTTVHLFWAEGPRRFHVRNAFPPGGVVEDPATGAAAAAFGGYLRSVRLVQPPARLTLLQGRHMGTPSRLIVDVTAEAVQVTGIASRLDLP